METECDSGAFMPLELELQGGRTRSVVVKNDGAATSSDGGLMVLSRIELRRRWIRRLAGCFQDSRDANRVSFSAEVLLRQLVFGLAQGYEDLVDHDQWRGA